MAANSADLATQQAMRSIAIQNWSSNDITKAHVQTTDGKVWELGKGGVSRNEAAEIIVPARDCIANVIVTMKNGHDLQLNGLHDCKDTQIVVRNDQISIPEQAIPGAKQKNTPG